MARRTAPPAGTGAPDPATRLAIADRIVDETLAVAAEVGWDGVRLRSVAERLGIPLSELNTHYRDLDAIADAWLGRGVAAMLAPPPEGFADRPAAERVEAVVLRFLDALATHRSATAAMVVGKLWPAHPHHWAPLIFNLSRTVHWVREAALLDARGVRRQIEEVALTALLVAVFAFWSCDRSEGQARTRAFLRRRLERGARGLSRLTCRGGRRFAAPEPQAEPEAA